LSFTADQVTSRFHVTDNTRVWQTAFVLKKYFEPYQKLTGNDIAKTVIYQVLEAQYKN
jgi:hypothetical protein